MAATFTPDPAVKQEFDKLIAVFTTLADATKSAKKKYCDGVPANDSSVVDLYNQIDSFAEQASLYDDHIRQHHVQVSTA